MKTLKYSNRNPSYFPVSAGLPSYYGDLPNLGANLPNPSEEEEQQTVSYPDISLVLRSEVTVQSTDNDQQFWADNELESESSSLLHQVSNVKQIQSQQKDCCTTHPAEKPLANSTEKTSSGARTSKLKRKLPSPSPTSSSSSAESNISINGSNKNALLSCTPSESKHQSSSQLCWRCLAHSRNAVFIHGMIGHQCCCYHCALKLWRTKGNCPMCNQRIKKMVKIVTPKSNNKSSRLSACNFDSKL